MKANYLGMVTVILWLWSCNKPDTNNGMAIQKKKADELAAFIKNKNFQLTAFYSDRLIDYDLSDDTVKQETDLWNYVKPYIIDDIDHFGSDRLVTITQNATKIPNDGSPEILKDYTVNYDNQYVYLNFVDYNYYPLNYKLSSFDSTGFTVYTDWLGRGAKLFSRFSRE